jgi:hypothetical protein
MFNREYKASFEDSGNSVFYCFNRKVHVSKDLPDFAKEEDVHVRIDFNVGIQASSEFALRGGQVHYLNEFKGHPDTDTLAIAIKARHWPNYNNVDHEDFGKKICKIYVYPDPTGKSRKTSAAVGTTDLSILANHGFIVQALPASPGIIDSVACVNRLLKTAAGDIHLYIHPRCVGTIESLERTEWVERNPDSAALDKSKGVEHFSDSVRYPMEFLFPIKRILKATKRGFNF